MDNWCTEDDELDSMICDHVNVIYALSALPPLLSLLDRLLICGLVGTSPPSPSSSPSVMDSALLSMLALLLCHGRLLSLVLGLEPVGSCGLRAV